jgi:hypothetical protein
VVTVTLESGSGCVFRYRKNARIAGSAAIFSMLKSPFSSKENTDGRASAPLAAVENALITDDKRPYTHAFQFIAVSLPPAYPPTLLW